MNKTEAQKRADKKYMAKMETILLRMTPEEKEKIKECAREKGISINAFIRQAVKRQVEQQK